MKTATPTHFLPFGHRQHAQEKATFGPAMSDSCTEQKATMHTEKNSRSTKLFGYDWKTGVRTWKFKICNIDAEVCHKKSEHLFQ